MTGVAPPKDPAKDILVTGGAGFIGSNIAARLAEDGHRVTVADWFGTSEKWRNIAGTPLADLVLPEAIDALLARQAFDAIVHMGAISATTERDVDLIARTNIDLSRRLLDHCTREGVRFIYASSAATYGDGGLGFDDDDTLQALQRLRPLNAYGWSKSVFDLMVARRRADGAPLPPQCVGLKFFNVFGPNEYHKDDMRSVVAKVFEHIERDEPVTLFKSHRDDYADGGQSRDFVYVGDCVDVVAWLLGRPDVSGLFNVGTGQARAFLDLAHAVFAALDRRPEIVFVPMPETLRENYQYFTQAEMGRLRQAGYATPFTSLEDGVRDYVQSYLVGHRFRVAR